MGNRSRPLLSGCIFHCRLERRSSSTDKFAVNPEVSLVRNLILGDPGHRNSSWQAEEISKWKRTGNFLPWQDKWSLRDYLGRPGVNRRETSDLKQREELWLCYKGPNWRQSPCFSFTHLQSSLIQNWLRSRLCAKNKSKNRLFTFEKKKV